MARFSLPARRMFAAIAALAVCAIPVRDCRAQAAPANPAQKPVAALNDPKPPVPITSPPLIERAARPGMVGVAKRVLALYYPWYGMPPHSPGWMHQDKFDPVKRTLGSHAHFPASGPYDSTDPAVIDRHLKAAASAGIDTLVCSWWGREDPTDKAIRALLARAEQSHEITACAYWERLQQIRSKETTLDELCYLLGTLAKSSSYLRVDGRPVVFFFQRVCESLTPEDWAWVLNEASRRVPPGLVAIGESATPSDVVLWDGVSDVGAFYQVAPLGLEGVAGWWKKTYDVPTLVARRAHQVSVVSVTPGYDDRKANSLAQSTIATYVDRQGGSLYGVQWELAARSGADWVLVNSFNQWHAGTEIEPSVDYGDKYLKLTQEYAAKFKAPAGAVAK